jgi:hypothetical protein
MSSINTISLNQYNYNNFWGNISKPSQREVIKDYVVELASSKMSHNSPITDEWLSGNIGAARFIARYPGFAAGYLNENPDQAQRIVDNPDEAEAVLNEAIVERVSALLADDSPITDEWLSDNIGTARFIARHADFAAGYLNENPDQAQRIVDNPDDAVAILNEAIVEHASTLLADDSPITDEWLSDNIEAARVIARHAGLAKYLNENPDQAGRFMVTA